MRWLNEREAKAFEWLARDDDTDDIYEDATALHALALRGLVTFKVDGEDILWIETPLGRLLYQALKEHS